MYFANVRLPDHFYSAIHPLRWRDEFVHDSGEDKLVLTPAELKARYDRTMAYRKWLGRKGLGVNLMKWQLIQVMTFKHSEFSKKDWWENYQDALFRVFVQPQTLYCPVTKEHKQWYVLCPEDSEMVLRHEWEKKNPTLPPRSALKGERWVSKDKRLRKAKLIPVECCRHWRHETTAGQLPEGL